ncbi:MAG: PorV/PorQ family protein [bacterium]|nr:PorV/PorQ family protein [bacterium]
MKHNRLILTVALLAVIGLCFQAWAGNPEKKGTAGAEELLIPVGSRGVALGGASMACINGVDAIYWNPAGVANTTNSTEAMFSYMKYIADINVTYGALAVKTGLGSIGVSFQSLSFGDIAVTTTNNPDGTGSMWSPTYMTLGATYSRSMTDRIFVGGNVKFISEKIMSTSASAFAVDMGVQYLTSIGVRLGVAMKNVGTPVRFDGTDLERRVAIPGTPSGAPPQNLRIVAQESELPSTFEMGLSYARPVVDKVDMTLMANFRNNNFLNDEVSGGIEVDVNHMFFMRGGYTYALNESGEDVAGGKTYIYGPAFGMGLMYPMAQQMKVAFDFAYRTTEYFSENLLFTAKVIF